MTTFLNEIQKYKTKLLTFEKISKFAYENSIELFIGFTPIFAFTIYYKYNNNDWCEYCKEKYYNLSVKKLQNSCYCDNPIYLFANIVVSAIGNPIQTKPDETIFKIDFIEDYCLKSELNKIFYKYEYYKINKYKSNKKTIFSVYNSMDENDEISKKLVNEIFNCKYAKYIKNENKSDDLNIYGNFFYEFNGKESRDKYYLCFIDIINNIMKATPQIDKKENPHICMKKKN